MAVLTSNVRPHLPASVSARLFATGPNQTLRRAMPGILGVCFALALVGLYSCRVAHAAIPSPEVKAVLLFHLTEFVTWPAPPSSDQFTIGILGPDPFGSALAEALKDEKVGSRLIGIKRASVARRLTDCQVIFVSPEAREPLLRVFSVLANRPILTVGETPDFLEQGGMIRFAPTNENKLRLQIDVARARAAGLKLSAQLLRVADVRGDNP